MPDSSDKAQPHLLNQQTNPQDISAQESVPAPDADSLEITHPDNPLAPVVLEELPPSMQAACARAGWDRLMPVQSLALPYLMDGRDIMIQSRTGSGKTGCYLLPLVPALRPAYTCTQAMVLVPTRELALQVAKQAEVLMEGTGLNIAVLYGGVGYHAQREQLRKGAQLVIGTPGRILDHLLRGTLSLDNLRALVFDEADRMLSIGFYPDMKQVQRYLPKRRIYTSLFSATYPHHVLNLAKEFMLNPCLLSLSQKQVYVAEVQHCFCAVDRMDKDRALIRLIEMENPASAIIFCNTRANVHYVTGVLQGFGYNADELSADQSQNAREDVMRRVREGKVRFLVATDVAARGIDIPALSHVFLYEPPEDHESYIHRAGRTGRANAAGTVISLVDIMERMELDRIARHYSLRLQEIPNPTDDEVAQVVSGRLLTLLESRYRGLTSLQKVRSRRYVELARELASLAEDEESEGTGASLLAMLLDAFHHNTLNELALPSGKKAGRDGGEISSPTKEGEEKKRKSKRRRGKGRDKAQDAAGTQGKPEETREAAPVAETSADTDAGSSAEAGTDAAERQSDRSRRRRRPRRRKSSRSGKADSAQTSPQPQASGIGDD